MEVLIRGIIGFNMLVLKRERTRCMFGSNSRLFSFLCLVRTASIREVET